MKLKYRKKNTQKQGRIFLAGQNKYPWLKLHVIWMTQLLMWFSEISEISWSTQTDFESVILNDYSTMPLIPPEQISLRNKGMGRTPGLKGTYIMMPKIDNLPAETLVQGRLHHAGQANPAFLYNHTQPESWTHISYLHFNLGCPTNRPSQHMKKP